mmetsp:Transcript_9249/g.12526  ORF Transcript_9249/g.12526 Transcript_9249/m.12526 type:complete len:555 (-) Transcript_9249:322-1986(-)|eukprot:CAMPEP_0196573846 /NCGR_PEP_ID=MMETSP1081-20130531/3671_1 /TAXON_ID=36882 /ORGANISM="Pyramimonas amylifera, Strain CCMP720" /LENGTH=554 /DNA_ID=CAMNT_0041891683 /DNA_START=51 /DNA_END=1715 /DNA_ORIENTATION=-
MATLAEKLFKEIDSMDGSVGYDAVIVCTSTIQQEKFWQSRLQATRGQAAREGAIILAVHEDWGPDGAGNGLGTLYAYTKARAKAKESGIDLDSKLKEGWAVGMYHTAGKGTRLAPLPGSENNNKPGVKLPSVINLNGSVAQLTILEAVIRQTNSYAPVRKGRCSVFWGDQIFVPSAGTPQSGAAHADILACLGPMPSAEEWMEKGLDKYGLIAVNAQKEATQVEKVDFPTATRLLASFGTVEQVGPSLGSFSVSAALLAAFLKEFHSELEAKQAKMDSDPDFWMPLTLSGEAYCSVMKQKGVDVETSSDHYGRMQGFKAKFLATTPGSHSMLGAIDVGPLADCYWWDYGQLKLYLKNNMLATEHSEEAKALHHFMRITSRTLGSEVGGTVDDNSVLLSSRFLEGAVTNSVCTSVTAIQLEVEDCLLMNVTAKKIKAKGCVLYNVVDDSEEGLELEDGTVMVNVFMPGEDKLIMKSTIDTDGGKVFKTKMDCNPFSFDEVYKQNGSVDVSAATAELNAAASALAQTLLPPPPPTLSSEMLTNAADHPVSKRSRRS